MNIKFIHINLGPPVKLFRHYVFSSVGTPDTPLQNPGRKALVAGMSDITAFRKSITVWYSFYYCIDFFIIFYFKINCDGWGRALINE